MPALKQNGMLVYFAAFKQHIGFFPPDHRRRAPERAAARYAGPKGNLRFPYDEPIPYELIAALTKLRARQDAAKARQSTTGSGRKTAFACSSMMMRSRPVLLALPHARDQEHGDDDEPDDEPPPQADGAVVEPEAEPQAHGHADAPEADDVDDHRHARIAEPAQQADRDDLQAVEYLEHAGERQQQRREREHRRIARVEARERLGREE